ncbi:ketol-acid reductoisomerase [Candidatus Peregrinibacteria bacterium]|nr:ketol-acid reductoisomerase [Candidatus Peregrinibacteria bacterium]
MGTIQLFHDSDANVSILDGKKIAVIGYGAQGRAQARMLHESGVQVIVGAREGGKSWNQIIEDGLSVATISEAAKQAEIIHMLIPDESQKSVYESDILQHMTPGKILCFSHGFNIVFKRIIPSKNIGVIMVAPKAPGTEEYKCYRQGFGVPALISVYQDIQVSNDTANDNTMMNSYAKAVALAMAKAMFFTKAGVMECTFEQETHEDLFGEQAVLCGGITELIKTGFEVLTEAGYPPQLAYFECLHEAKLIVDLIHEGGLSRMWEVVSNTAEYGGHTRGSRIITPQTKVEMKKILREVEDGTFAREWMNEADNNTMKKLLEMRKKESEHPVEVVGRTIRAMFQKKT